VNPVSTCERPLLVVAWVRPRTFHVLRGGRCLCGVRIPTAGTAGWPAAVVPLDGYLAEASDGAAWGPAFTGEAVRACRRCQHWLARGLRGAGVWAVRSRQALVEAQQLIEAQSVRVAHTRLTRAQVKAVAQRRIQERGEVVSSGGGA